MVETGNLHSSLNNQAQKSIVLLCINLKKLIKIIAQWYFPLSVIYSCGFIFKESNLKNNICSVKKTVSKSHIVLHKEGMEDATYAIVPQPFTTLGAG